MKCDMKPTFKGSVATEPLIVKKLKKPIKKSSKQTWKQTGKKAWRKKVQRSGGKD